MKSSYELNYVLMNEEQVEQFSCNITSEIINNYFLEHQEEFFVWQNTECLKQLIKQSLRNTMTYNLDDRRKLLRHLRREKVNE